MSISEKFKSVAGSLSGKSCSAVILAGGSGNRFSNDTDLPKQYVKLRGLPVIVYSLKAFDASPLVREIVVVSREEDISRLEFEIKKYPASKPVKIVTGGNTRQESALIGFNATSEKYPLVAIHDAARPLITTEAIDKVITEAARCKAAIAASPSVDTPKIVSRSRTINEKAPAREFLWLAQTPQIFDRTLYRTAAYYAKDKGFEATDDASLLEFAGFDVKVVDIGIVNLKITYPDDVILANAIIEKR